VGDVTITETRPEVIEIPAIEEDQDDDDLEYVDPPAVPTEHPEWGM
jgi:hypothetical protein